MFLKFNSIKFVFQNCSVALKYLVIPPPLVKKKALPKKKQLATVKKRVRPLLSRELNDLNLSLPKDGDQIVENETDHRSTRSSLKRKRLMDKNNPNIITTRRKQYNRVNENEPSHSAKKMMASGKRPVTTESHDDDTEEEVENETTSHNTTTSNNEAPTVSSNSDQPISILEPVDYDSSRVFVEKISLCPDGMAWSSSTSSKTFIENAPKNINTAPDEANVIQPNIEEPIAVASSSKQPPESPKPITEESTQSANNSAERNKMLRALLDQEPRCLNISDKTTTSTAHTFDNNLDSMIFGNGNALVSDSEPAIQSILSVAADIQPSPIIEESSVDQYLATPPDEDHLTPVLTNSTISSQENSSDSTNTQQEDVSLQFSDTTSQPTSSVLSNQIEEPLLPKKSYSTNKNPWTLAKMAATSSSNKNLPSITDNDPTVSKAASDTSAPEMLLTQSLLSNVEDVSRSSTKKSPADLLKTKPSNLLTKFLFGPSTSNNCSMALPSPNKNLVVPDNEELSTSPVNTQPVVPSTNENANSLDISQEAIIAENSADEQVTTDVGEPTHVATVVVISDNESEEALNNIVDTETSTSTTSVDNQVDEATEARTTPSPDKKVDKNNNRNQRQPDLIIISDEDEETMLDMGPQFDSTMGWEEFDDFEENLLNIERRALKCIDKAVIKHSLMKDRQTASTGQSDEQKMVKELPCDDEFDEETRNVVQLMQQQIAEDMNLLERETTASLLVISRNDYSRFKLHPNTAADQSPPSSPSFIASSNVDLLLI